MLYQVIIYCPDKHILYDPSTPERKGVGGGLMARIRLAQALANLGHRVTLLSHVPREAWHRGVRYLPLSQAGRAQSADVLLMISSGGALSLQQALELNVDARLREIWLQGTIPIQGIEHLDYDVVVGASNFICDVVEREWGLARAKLYSIYNGAALANLSWWQPHPMRDPYALVYTSHPSKGLNASLEVLKRLRQQDERFRLHVFGGDALWGGADQKVDAPGVVYHGTQGQQKVLRALLNANISLNLQNRLEPFGMVVTEAMKHGAIPVASAAGAYTETIRHGYDGFLIEGDAESSLVHQQAAEFILALSHTPAYAEYIRHNALQMPWTWERQAQTWLQHWDWLLNKKGHLFKLGGFACPRCQGSWLATADGYHCVECGFYSRDGR